MEPDNEVDINAPDEVLLKATEQANAFAAANVVADVAAPVPENPDVAVTHAPAAQQPSEAFADEPHLSPVRTFSSDMAEAIRSKGGSVVRIAIAEEEKRRRAYEENSIRSKKNIMLLAVGGLLIAGALGVGWYAYSRHKAAQTVQIAPKTAPDSIVTSEDWTTIDVTGLAAADVLAKIQALVAVTAQEDGTVKNVILTQKTAAGSMGISASQLLSVLAPAAPNDLVRALKDDFMLGVYKYGTGHVFLIIHGTAHDFLLSGMLGWENKGLFSAMAPLFGIDISGYSKDDLAKMVFEETLIENRDARAVLDADNKPVLYYSFIDQDTILIASDPKTLPEVVRRF